TLRGKRIVYREYIEAGKAREVSWGTTFGIFIKFGMGASQQFYNRYLYYLNTSPNFSWSQRLSHFFGGIGFFFRKPWVIWGNLGYVLFMLFMGISGFQAFPEEILYGLLGIFIFSQAITFTGFFQYILERPLIKGILDFLWMWIRNFMFFMAQVFTYAAGVKRAMLGIASYVGTGRGFMLTHTKLSDIIKNYTKTHIIWGFLGTVISVAGIWIWWNPTLLFSLPFVLMFISAMLIPFITNKGFIIPIRGNLESKLKLLLSDIKDGGQLVKQSWKEFRKNLTKLWIVIPKNPKGIILGVIKIINPTNLFKFRFIERDQWDDFKVSIKALIVYSLSYLVYLLIASLPLLIYSTVTILTGRGKKMWKVVEEKEEKTQRLKRGKVNEIDNSEIRSGISGFKTYIKKLLNLRGSHRLVAFGGAVRDYLLRRDKKEDERLHPEADIDLLVRVDSEEATDEEKLQELIREAVKQFSTDNPSDELLGSIVAYIEETYPEYKSYFEGKSLEEIRAEIFGEGKKKDNARSLPGESMPSREKIEEEIRRHNINNLKIISADSQEVKIAIKVLRLIEESEMAEYLEYLAKAGFIRAGPFEGFLASVYSYGDKEYILLSDYYPICRDSVNQALSLVHEIGATSKFNKSHQENEERVKKIYKYSYKLLELLPQSPVLVRDILGFIIRTSSDKDILRKLMSEIEPYLIYTKYEVRKEIVTVEANAWYATWEEEREIREEVGGEVRRTAKELKDLILSSLLSFRIRKKIEDIVENIKDFIYLIISSLYEAILDKILPHSSAPSTSITPSSKQRTWMMGDEWFYDDSSSDWSSDLSQDYVETVCQAYERRGKGDPTSEFVDVLRPRPSYRNHATILKIDLVNRKVRHITWEEYQAHPNKYWDGLSYGGQSYDDYKNWGACGYGVYRDGEEENIMTKIREMLRRYSAEVSDELRLRFSFRKPKDKLQIVYSIKVKYTKEESFKEFLEAIKFCPHINYDKTTGLLTVTLGLTEEEEQKIFEVIDRCPILTSYKEKIQNLFSQVKRWRGFLETVNACPHIHYDERGGILTITLGLTDEEINEVLNKIEDDKYKKKISGFFNQVKAWDEFLKLISDFIHFSYDKNSGLLTITLGVTEGLAEEERKIFELLDKHPSLVQYKNKIKAIFKEIKSWDKFVGAVRECPYLTYDDKTGLLTIKGEITRQERERILRTIPRRKKGSEIYTKLISLFDKLQNDKKIFSYQELPISLREKLKDLPQDAKRVLLSKNIYIIISEDLGDIPILPFIWYESAERFVVACVDEKRIYLPLSLIELLIKTKNLDLLNRIIIHEEKHLNGEPEDIQEAERLANEVLKEILKYIFFKAKERYDVNKLNSLEVEFGDSEILNGNLSVLKDNTIYVKREVLESQYLLYLEIEKQILRFLFSPKSPNEEISIALKVLESFRNFSESQQQEILIALEKINKGKTAYYKMLEKAKYETERFLTSAAYINGKRIDILGAIDEEGRIYINPKHQPLFEKDQFYPSISRLGVALDLDDIYYSDKTLEDLQDKVLAVRDRLHRHWEDITIEQVFMFLRLLVQYPELEVERELMDCLVKFFAEPAYFKNGLNALKQRGERAQVAGARPAVPAGTGAPQQVAVTGGTGAVQQRAVVAGTGAPQQVAVAAGTGAPQQVAVATGTGAAQQVARPVGGVAIEGISFGDKQRLEELILNLFKYAENKETVITLLDKNNFLKEMGIDLRELARRPIPKIDGKTNFDRDDDELELIEYFVYTGRIDIKGKSRHEQRELLLEYLLGRKDYRVPSVFITEDKQQMDNFNVQDKTEEILREVGLDNDAEFNNMKNEIVRVFELARGWLKEKYPNISLNSQGMLHILYIIANVVLVFEFNRYVRFDKKAEELREQKPKTFERRGHSYNVPLVGRNPHPMSREKGLKLIANLIEKGTPFFVAFMDIDDMTKYHQAFGKHLKLAGKVRLIIEEVISYMNEVRKTENVKIYQIKGTEDESFILVEGVDTEAKAQEIIEEIRERVAAQSRFRLGVAELENVYEFNRTDFETISVVTGYEMVKPAESYTILFDILPDKTAEESLNLLLEGWNEFLLLERGIYLRAKVVSAVPAFSISIAGALHKKDAQALPENKDERIKKAEETLKELIKIIDPKLDRMKKRGPQRVTEFTEKFQPIKKEIQRPSIASEKIPDELAKRFQDDIAIIVLKGGRLGGLYPRLRKILLERLDQDFKINLGRVKRISADEVLKVWGHAIKDRLERLRDDLEKEEDKAEVDKAIGYVDLNNGEQFEKWIEEVKEKI
ncbi:MAG: hypothetical protein NC820_05415, partial [Candidatus Omnitrophica bacterium]|nr:hypothetical protein [Candidatus Omnitrophota bacterium]